MSFRMFSLWSKNNGYQRTLVKWRSIPQKKQKNHLQDIKSAVEKSLIQRDEKKNISRISNHGAKDQVPKTVIRLWTRVLEKPAEATLLGAILREKNYTAKQLKKDSNTTHPGRWSTLLRRSLRRQARIMASYSQDRPIASLEVEKLSEEQCLPMSRVEGPRGHQSHQSGQGPRCR